VKEKKICQKPKNQILNDGVLKQNGFQISLFFFKKIHNFPELFDKLSNRYNKTLQKISEFFD